MRPPVDLAGMRVLVTGGSGYVGRHLVRALVSRGAVPIVYARRPVPGGIVGAVEDLGALTAATKGADAVVHLATSPAYKAEADPLGDAQVNILGTLNVLRAALDCGVGRVICGSSAHVYGFGAGPVTEDAPRRPSSLYGASKAAGELYVGAFQASHRLAATVLRFSTLFGIPEGGGPPPNVVQVFAKRAIAGEPLVLHGPSGRPLDLLDVREAADAIVLALERTPSAGHTYNIGSGSSLPLRDVAETIVSAAGSASEIRVDERSDTRSLPVLVVRKAERELEFRPTADPRPNIACFVRWWRGTMHGHSPAEAQ